MALGMLPLEARRVPLAHYALTADGADSLAGGRCTLKNIEFRDGGAFVGGQYEEHDICTPCFGELDKTNFGLEVEFQPAESRNQWVAVAGAGYRWFGIGTDGNGHLQVTANNQDDVHTYPDVMVEPLTWHKVSVNVEFHKLLVQVCLDGADLDPWMLPASFELHASSRVHESCFTTTNFSNGIAFHGLIRNLHIYGRPIIKFKAVTVTAKSIEIDSVMVSCFGMAGDLIFESAYESDATFDRIRAELAELSPLTIDEAFKLLAVDGTELMDDMPVSVSLSSRAE